MPEYQVGYCKPPKATRFKLGHSGNPKGRPPRLPSPLGDIVKEVLDAPTQVRENGQLRTATRREVGLMSLVARAVKGDVPAAEVLIQKYAHAHRLGAAGSRQVLITDWLPDYSGQTGVQKTQELKSASSRIDAVAVRASSDTGLALAPVCDA